MFKKYFYIFIWILYFVLLFVLKNISYYERIKWLDKYLEYIDKIIQASFSIVFLIILTLFINKIFKKIKQKEKKSPITKQIFPILNKTIIVFIWIIWIITIIWNLGYNINALVAWAWVWGLAIALAAQKSVSNIFWAISVIINKPFLIWDFVRIWNYMWTVQDIWLTYLKIKDLEWHMILIPNENIISSSVENLSLRENRTAKFNIWLTYNTDLKKVKKAVEIIQNILAKFSWEEIEDKISSFRVAFDNFWDFSLNISVIFFSRITDLDEFTIFKQNINLEIKKQFEKEKIEFAFPTQTIYLQK